MEPSNLSSEPEYPVRFSVEYPDRDLNRLTTALRLFVVRLEPRAVQVLEPDRRLPRVDGRPLPVSGA
jgi:hypothetical protein